MTTWRFLASHVLCAEMDGVTRLVDGSAGPGYEYGRLEIFERGFWSNVCNNDRFTPDAAEVACRALGYGGGAALRFTQSYASSLSPVRSICLKLHFRQCAVLMRARLHVACLTSTLRFLNLSPWLSV